MFHGDHHIIIMESSLPGGQEPRTSQLCVYVYVYAVYLGINSRLGNGESIPGFRT